MFIHFSWLQYGVVAIAATAAYYAWVGWRYYRPEIRQLFAARSGDEELWEEEVYEPVGRAAGEEGSALINAEDMEFAEPLDMRGVIPDLLEEIKSLAGIAETKEDFLSLFKIIAAKYPQVAGSPQQGAVYAFIREHVAFQLTDSELNPLFQ
ncbi:hypothetical protein [Mucilaginibacter paludis]|uniref:Uncharacterized protein n=1 Tax=Mucilaginibacter paludis DSM 18603 TaxID=714943 RepID=H1XZ37_9SPHI|nr:hypothetical protein [Mucilaginibacter paludis]EHQ24622.1 hypothetical protein Mucpa_0428 [Mucilaginibacter paludis DSM 18603]